MRPRGAARAGRTGFFVLAAVFAASGSLHLANGDLWDGITDLTAAAVTVFLSALCWRCLVVSSHLLSQNADLLAGRRLAEESEAGR
jgi:hypothetical protein